MKIAISGSTGYIGNCLLLRANSRGFSTVELRRIAPSSAKSEWVQFSINNKDNIILPQDIQIVYHLAATTNTIDFDIEQEVSAAAKLIESTKKINAHFVFISSQSAQLNAPTSYGKAKWEIEKLVAASSGTIIRPGQVYGGKANGLFGILLRYLKSCPIIPRFIPEPRIQPIHVDDLVEAMLSPIIIDERCSTLYCLGDPKSILLSDFLKCISRYRLNKIGFILPIPVLLLNISSIIPSQIFKPAHSVKRIKSLLQLPRMETTKSLNNLKLKLRPIHIGMTPNGANSRRMLIKESKALLTYVLKNKPSVCLIKHYVKAVEKLRNGSTLHLSECIFRWPGLIAAIDNQKIHNELAWRLNAAVSLAEACPMGAERFLGIDRRSNFLLASLRIIQAMTKELAWRLVSPMISFTIKLDKNNGKINESN